MTVAIERLERLVSLAVERFDDLYERSGANWRDPAVSRSYEAALKAVNALAALQARYPAAEQAGETRITVEVKAFTDTELLAAVARADADGGAELAATIERRAEELANLRYGERISAPLPARPAAALPRPPAGPVEVLPPSEPAAPVVAVGPSQPRQDTATWCANCRVERARCGHILPTEYRSDACPPDLSRPVYGIAQRPRRRSAA